MNYKENDIEKQKRIIKNFRRVIQDNEDKLEYVGQKMGKHGKGYVSEILSGKRPAVAEKIANYTSGYGFDEVYLQYSDEKDLEANLDLLEITMQATISYIGDREELPMYSKLYKRGQNFEDVVSWDAPYEEIIKGYEKYIGDIEECEECPQKYALYCCVVLVARFYILSLKMLISGIGDYSYVKDYDNRYEAKFIDNLKALRKQEGEWRDFAEVYLALKLVFSFGDFYDRSERYENVVAGFKIMNELWTMENRFVCELYSKMQKYFPNTKK